MKENVSRRDFIKVAGATAALGATAAFDSGCTPVSEPKTSSISDFDWINQFLPLGSVVTLASWPDWVEFLIVARRPRVTVGEDNKPDKNGSSHATWDYAGVIFPYGYMGDLALESSTTETNLFHRDSITSLRHLGLQDASENSVVALLNKEITTTVSNPDILGENFHQYMLAVKKED